MNRTLFAINSVLLICLIMSNTRHVERPANNQSDNSDHTPTIFSAPGKLQAAPGVQVNSLPHPFNLGGSMPYQVWVNGERLPLNSDKANKIVELLDIGPFEQPKNTGDIHSGAGWLRPLNITQ